MNASLPVLIYLHYEKSTKNVPKQLGIDVAEHLQNWLKEMTVMDFREIEALFAFSFSAKISEKFSNDSLVSWSTCALEKALLKGI